MEKKYILGIFTIFVIVLLAFKQGSSNGIKTKAVFINGAKLTVEVADTERLRNQGLSGRSPLPVNSGMLFVFPVAAYYQFWMKEMKFPLDFIWIEKGKVVDLTENVPPSKSSGEKLPIFTAKYPFDQVIEVNAGTIRSLNIHLDDKVY